MPSEKHEKTEALHLKTGNKHVVGVKALHVMLIPDGNYWFAQGLEIDYAAYAASLEDAKENFSNGLALTVAEHLTMYGDIKKLLHVASQDVWDEYYAATGETIKASLTQIQATEVTKKLPKVESSLASVLPFGEIHFLKGAATAAEPAVA
jgi:hypothetical protein